MAQIEIYKLKKTVLPKVRTYGMFEYFGMGEGPLPNNYVREWSGELPIDNLETLYGRFMLNPPAGYYGGSLEKSDIAVLNGKAYFLDRVSSRYKFAEVHFDTSAVKDAIHVVYGYPVNAEGAQPISRELAAICEKLEIPIGYTGTPDYHGSHKGEELFNQKAGCGYSLNAYLHPQFLKGDEARAFIGLLTELSKKDRWEEIAIHLRVSYPVRMDDLKSACEIYAPELLISAEARVPQKESVIAKIREAQTAGKAAQPPKAMERSGHKKSHREER